MGTDHDVRYKNKTPQPDNQKELAPSLTLSQSGTQASQALLHIQTHQ